MKSARTGISGSPKIKILHLEDLPSDAELVEHMLRKANIEFELKLVSTRTQYAEALEEFEPELIISDHSLPSFNSMDALELLRKSKLKIPFVLVTGTVSEEFAVLAMRAGADDYILKDRLQRLPVAIQGVLEKYRLEHDKRKSETLLRNIDANSLDMICSVSEDGYFLHVSAASETILGYTPAELIGKRPFDFVYAEDKQNTIDSANYVMAGNLLTNFENRYVRKDGSLVTLSWSARWDEHDRVRYGVARDVTEKNIADEKIRQAETLLRNIETNSLDVICTIDRGGLFIYVSPASLKLLGYTPGELVGRNFKELVYEGDKAATEKVNNDALSGHDITMFENRYVRKDGSLVTLLWSSHYEAKEQIIYCIAKDVTELKKAEKVIAAERKRLSDLFMNAPVSMCITSGRDHVFELANPIYLELAGKKDIIGKAGIEAFPELEAQGILKLLDNIYDTGQPFTANEMELKIDREGNGKCSVFYHNVLQQPYLDVDGNVAGLFYFGIDVTEQVLTRKKIEEAEKRYRQIVETAQEGMWVVDENDKTTFVNSKMCELFEYTQEEMMGKEIYEFMDDEGKKIAVNLMQNRRSGKSGRGYFKYISKTGREIWANVSANPLFREDGSYEGALAMITDITDQKKIEEENKKLSDVASLTVNAVIVTDPEGRVTWVNKGFERITEYTLPEVMGKKPGDVLQGRDTDPATKRHMSDCVKKGEGFRVEVLNYSKSGREYWLDIEVRPIHDSQSKLTGFMAIEQDITAQKTIEHERLTLIDGLQNRNKELQQFSYIVSHNLRAPIAKIMGLVSVMESESEENKFLLEKLTEEAAHLDDVVKDINTIVSARKSAKEKMEQVFFETKLNLIKQVLEDNIVNANAVISSDFSEAPEIRSIKSYVYSILYNLISNAIKYRKPVVPPQIEVKTFQDEKFICLSVKDNGEGIDLAKNGGKVFGLYKRFHTGGMPGKGIGLNLVKTHAESLGGRVEIESELTVGTTFRVYIPKYDDKTV